MKSLIATSVLLKLVQIESTLRNILLFPHYNLPFARIISTFLYCDIPSLLNISYDFCLLTTVYSLDLIARC